MSLLNDIARCHDAACPQRRGCQRRGCQRFLERDTGGPATPSVATLRIFSGVCQGLIPPEPVVEHLPDGAYRITVGAFTSTVSSMHLVEARIAQLQLRLTTAPTPC
jgi:hypothetical protein